MESEESLSTGLRATEPLGERSATYSGTTGPMPSDDLNSLEPWQQSMLSKGNRVGSPSVAGCLRSLAYLHNETVNIYSHVLGALVFFALPIYIFKTESPPRYRVITTADRLVCSIYFCCAFACFLLSAISHTLRCHSERVSVLMTRIHSVALILLVWGANIPLIYYGFFCDLILQIIYWTAAFTIASICSAFSLYPIGYIERHPRQFETATWAALASSVMVPVVHGLVAHGLPEQVPRLNLQWILYSLIVFTFGFAANALKWPESFKYRTFDIFGASHQIMHVMILGASVMYTFGILGQVDYVYEHEMSCP